MPLPVALENIAGVPVDAAHPLSVTLEGGLATLATAAKQDVGNASLSSIDGKLSALGPQPKADSVSITFADDIPPLAVNIGSTVDRQSTGAMTSTQTVELATQGCGTIGLQLSGTWTGAVYFESTIDGSTWNAFKADSTTDSGSVVSATANGTWQAACAGFQAVRLRGDVGSGSATGYLNASTASTTVVLGDALPPGSNAIGSVSVSSSALPSGASTAALQDAGNTSLASLDTKAPALVSGRVPVDASGVTVTVTGTVTANVGTTNGLALDATLTGGTAKVLLFDGTNTIGTSGRPIRTDPTGSTAQPITDNAGSLTVDTPQLPASLGATTKSGSLSVAIATDQVGAAGTAAANVLTVQGIAGMTAVKVDGSAAAQPVTDNGGTLTVDSAQLPASLGITTKSASLSVALASDQTGTAGAASSTVMTVQGVASMTPVQVSQASASALNATVVGAGTAGSASGGVLTVQGVASMTPVLSRISDGTNAAAIKAASTPAAATDPALVVEQSPNSPSLTPAITSRASSGSSVTLLASNSARKSASFFNNDVNDLYLNEAGGTATTAIGGFTVVIPYRGYWELPRGANGGVVTGAITGIWSAAGSSGASVTERS